MEEKTKSDNEGRQKMILGTTNIDYVCLHGKGLPSRANMSSMSIKVRLSFRLLLRKNLS